MIIFNSLVGFATKQCNSVRCAIVFPGKAIRLRAFALISFVKSVGRKMIKSNITELRGLQAWLWLL
jgi:hypothetical protein